MDIPIHKQQIIDEFIKIIKIPSPSKNEKGVADYIRARCKQLNIELMEDDTTKETGSNSGNIICFIKGTCERAEPLYFTAHMDTIETKKVYPIIQQSVVMTDGTTALGADDKAGVIALLESVAFLKRSDEKHGDIQLIFTVCEEQGLIGAQALNHECIRGNYGYTIDADEPVGTFITRSPALSTVTITVSAKEDIQPNNVHQTLSHFIRSISKQPMDKDATRTITGFRENNNVMHAAMDVTIELKEFLRTPKESFVHTIKECIEEIYDEKEVAYTMHVDHMCSGYVHTMADRIVEVPTKAASKIGLSVNHITREDISDANIFSHVERPTLNIGAGYESIHTTNETMPVDQLYALTRLIIAICLEVVDP